MILHRQHDGNQNRSVPRVEPEPSRAISRFCTYCCWQVVVNPSGTLQLPEQVAPGLWMEQRPLTFSTRAEALVVTWEGSEGADTESSKKRRG
ncbi:hypothetical protein E2C01_024150 [Portunus trituberculatus]|uniref:Uncharacterized protein n=1 Tax=Portunus trituberculatus TaxID=210409 RepID=A0A5B7EBY0_PORTR|nr:hypothetical protein [Portunus trituberculatus]